MRDSHAGTAVLLCGGAAAEVAGWGGGETSFLVNALYAA